MSTDPEDKPGEEGQEPDDADADGRPTVAPPFDPVAFAKEVLGGKPSPMPGTLAATAPPPLGPPPIRRPTPRGLLSLANARIPSNLPPRITTTPAIPPVAAPRNHGADDEGGAERDWEDLSTRPPPPMQQDLIDAMARGEGPMSASDKPQPPARIPSSPRARSEAEERTVSPARSVAPVVPPTPQEMNDRVALGDYTGALEIAEKLLALTPRDESVRQCAETCRGVLRQMYTARVGPLDKVPMVMVARDQMRWLSIDHRAGFVLSLVDGVSTLEMILDVSGMPELDALRILSELAQQRIISFR
ncbi:MAG: hypothetical protein JWP97_270 [Labilithrix sp.]|nr:hypothetical protein [Labilithrix sp.]